MPIPPSDSVQKSESLEFETFPKTVEPSMHREAKYGNQFAYFEFSEPKGAQIIRHRFRVTTAELRWNVDPARVGRVDKWPATFEPYLGSDAAVTVNEDVRAELKKFLPQPTRLYSDLTDTMDWLDSNLIYDHSKASLQASALHALNNRRGHCSDYHGLCSAFGRALGYPTRVTYGMAAFDKNSPSHCKLEAYLPNYGWVSYDVSETQKLIKRIQSQQDLSEAEKTELVAAARARLRSGFRDNTWFLQTVGTDYELAPPASRPAKVVRTIYAEADGEPLPEPDPADRTKREFGWMTAHQFSASRHVAYPFKDIDGLRAEVSGK
jgi:transglutaminase-like putative cysteine protease